MSVKFGDQRRHGFHVGGLQIARRELTIELRVLRKTAHPHRVFDHRTLLRRAISQRVLSFSANLREPKAVFGPPQRGNVQIHGRGETTVQAQLFATKVKALFQSGKIQKSQVDRLLQLVGEIAGEQHPRDMGLDQPDVGGGMWIRCRIQQRFWDARVRASEHAAHASQTRRPLR